MQLQHLDVDVPTLSKKSASKKASKLQAMNKFIYLLAAIVVGASAFAAVYFYDKYQDLKNNPDNAAEEGVKTITDKLGKLMVYLLLADILCMGMRAL